MESKKYSHTALEEYYIYIYIQCPVVQFYLPNKTSEYTFRLDVSTTMATLFISPKGAGFGLSYIAPIPVT